MSATKPAGLLAAAAALAVSLSIQAEPDPNLAARLAAMQTSSTLTGMIVRDQAGHTLGKIDDLLVDFSSGRVVCVLMSTGSSHGEQVGVPATRFVSASQNPAVLRDDKAALKAAPRLPASAVYPLALAKFAADAHAYFKEKPAWDDQAGSFVPVRVSHAVGLSVRNHTAQDLGNLVNLMVDLPQARVFFAVISLDGTEQAQYAVPPTAMALNPDKTALLLDADKAGIAEAAQHGELVWKELTDPAWAAADYHRFGKELDTGGMQASVADPTRENVRARIDPTTAPATPAPNPAAGVPDDEITKRVLTEMIRQDFGNAFSYKQIKIITVNGQVTLQGKVKTQKQKDALGLAAANVVGIGNVDNQLQAKK